MCRPQPHFGSSSASWPRCRRNVSANISDATIFRAGWKACFAISRWPPTSTDWRATCRGMRHATSPMRLLSRSVPGTRLAGRSSPASLNRIDTIRQAEWFDYSAYPNSDSSIVSSSGCANVPTFGLTVRAKSDQRMTMASVCVPALNTISGSAVSAASAKTA
jgi:hypothetical protein